MALERKPTPRSSQISFSETEWISPVLATREGYPEFDIYSQPDWKQIRVGYIDPVRGYVTNADLCQANAHAKLNPGTQFIIQNRESVRYMNINEVNSLVDSTYSIDVEEGDHCSINWAQDDPKTPIVYFSGGGGVGAAANPIVGNESKSVIALHLVEGGFGYKYPPKVTVMSKTGVGGGVVAEAFLGEFHTGTEVYGDQSDIENYYPSDNQVNPVTGKKFPHNLSQECTATLNNVGFGSVWDAKGNPVRDWEPSFYNQTWENPFQREILDYQEYLRNALKPWFVSKRVHLSLNRVVGIEQQLKGEYIPTVVCSGIDKNDDYYYSRLKTFAGTTTKVYDVVKSEWGRYEKGDVTVEEKYDSSSTNAGVREVEFKVFAHLATAALNQGIPGGLRFEFREVKDSTLLANPLQVGDMGEQSYGPDRFSVSIDDIKEDSLSGDVIETKQAKTVFKNVKPGVLYHVISQGKWKGKSTEQGLINKLGIKPSERQLDSNDPRSDQSKVGQAIFADLIGSANDNDDLQIEAEIGQFTQVRKRWTEDGVKFNQPKSELKLKTFTDEHSSNYGQSTGEWEEVFIEPKGSTTYDLFYKVGNREIDDFNSKKDKSSPKNKGKEPDDTSFMNKYAISPVPASDDKGSDYANQMFTIEWEQSFDITGDYTFRAQAAGECYFYMDGVPINIHPNRTSPHRINSYTRAPSKWKEFIPTSTIKRIRCDITNTPKLEDVIIQSEGDGDEYVPDGSQFQDIEFDVFSHVAPQWSGWDKIDVSAPNDVTFTSTHGADYHNRFHVVEISREGFAVQYDGLHSANTLASMKPRTSDDAKYAGSVDNFICLKDGHGDDCNGQLVINNWQDAKFGADGRSIILHGENFKKNGFVDVEIRYHGSDGSQGGKHMRSLTIGDKKWNINNEGNSGPATKTVRLTGSGDGTVIKEIMVLSKAETKTVELISGVDYGCYFTSSGNTSNVTAEMTDNGKTIGIDDLGKGGSKARTNMVVKCNKGKWRSADGTDDSGVFGHKPLASNYKQIFWSMPKQAPSKPIDGTNGLKFTFNAVDGTHSFQVKSKDIHPAITYQKAALKKMLKKVKINTKYIVQATQLGKKETIEQGLMDKMGRDPKEINFSKNLMPSKRGQFIFADVRGSDHDKDDIQIGTTKGYFTALNRRQVKFSDETKKEGNKIIRVEKAYSTYDLEFYYEVKTEPTAVTPSGDIKFKTENIFNTVTNIKGASRDLYRTNAYGRGGFLNDSGVCPFPVIEDLQNSTLNDNPYAGEHKIVWNNIKFPVDADYNIKVAVDDAAVLKLEGPNGVTTINKEGFVNGKSTGSTIFRQYLKKGSYKLTALLIQKAGGRFGFKALTQAERQQRQQNILDTIKPAPLPPPKKTSMVTFTTSSEAGYTNACTIAGIAVLTRNATITKEVEVGKEYTVSFTSTGYGGSNERVQIKMADGGRKIKMEDSKDADFNDLVLTINGGRFDNIRDNRFVTYIGGLTDGDAAAQPKAEKPFPQSIDDIELKGINPMAIAIDIKVKYGTGKKVKAQSWNDNPFAVALSIEAPIKAPPQDDIPKSPGRCPDNPFWTTRHPLDHSLATETWFPVYLPPGRDGDRWHEFMNKYAMSPIPPMDDKGTDFGGKWYQQTWHKMIDSPGWYTFRAMADDNLRFFIGTLSGTEEISFFKRDKDNAPWGSLQEPIEKSIELSAGPTTFQVWVKNLSTTKYDVIKKKVFSARDWVGKGLNEDDFGGDKYDKHQFRDITFDVFAHVAKKFSFYGKEPEKKVIDVTFTSTDSADYENKFHVVEITQGEGFLVQYDGLHPANTPESMRPRTSDDAKYAGSVDNFICLKDGHGDDCNGQLVINDWQDAKFGADGRTIIPHGEKYKKNGFVDVEIRYYGSDGSQGGKHMKSLTIAGKTWNINNEGGGGPVQTVRLSGKGDEIPKVIMTLTRTQTKTIELKPGVDYGSYFTSSGNRSNVTAEMTNNGETIGIDDLGRGGSKARTNMVVKCSHGKWRSADGTDDTGVFGHTPLSSNYKQIYWSVPKSTTGLGAAFNRPEDELKFTFVEKGGKHKFTISGNELKNTTKDKNMFVSNTNSSLKKKIKMNKKYKVTASFENKANTVEQGLIKKLGRNAVEKDYNPNLLPSKRGSYIFADVAESTDENDDLQIGCTEGYFTASNKRKHTRPGRGDTYDLEYFVDWTPPAVTLNEYITAGTTKNGVTYEGPYLFKYIENGWSSYMNKFAVSPLDDPQQSLNSPDDRILGTKTLTWKNVNFELDGAYNYKFIGDDNAKLYVDGRFIKETSGTWTSKDPAEKTFNIPKAGRYDIKVELTNTGTNSLWFDNPSGMVLEITTDIQRLRYDEDGVIDSKSWEENPVGVSMECIPPPCAKERQGGGVVDDLLIIDPGPGDLIEPPPPGTTQYPIVLTIDGFEIPDGGINYNPNEKLRIGIGSNPPIWRDLELDNFSSIIGIKDPETPPGELKLPLITPDWPDLTLTVPTEGDGDPTPPGDPGDGSSTRTPPDTPPLTRPPGTGIGIGDGTDTPPTTPPPPGTPPRIPPTRIPPPGIPPTTTPPLITPPTTTPPDDPNVVSKRGSSIPKPTGVGAVIVPKIKVTPLLPDGRDPRTGLTIPENQIIQVTDLVGLKQTGWYDGRAYYGAVFYQNGIKYAGYYETAGVLIQVYDSKQESITATSTTLPSAILRQGTDVTVSDPRLNIPGTPQ